MKRLIVIWKIISLIVLKFKCTVSRLKFFVESSVIQVKQFWIKHVCIIHVRLIHELAEFTGQRRKRSLIKIYLKLKKQNIRSELVS